MSCVRAATPARWYTFAGHSMHTHSEVRERIWAYDAADALTQGREKWPSLVCTYVVPAVEPEPEPAVRMEPTP